MLHADRRGQVRQLVVSNGETSQVIGSDALSVSGNALVAGEGQGEATARSQPADRPAPEGSETP